MKWYSSMVLFKYLYYYVIAWLEINYKRSFIFLYLISGQWVRNRCLCFKWISIQKCKQFKIICWTNYDLLEFLLGFTLFCIEFIKSFIFRCGISNQPQLKILPIFSLFQNLKCHRRLTWRLSYLTRLRTPIVVSFIVKLNQPWKVQSSKHLQYLDRYTFAGRQPLNEIMT